jgi:hypothetical protein
MPIPKNPENKRKTTRGIMEKLVKRLKTGCFNSNLIRKGRQIGKKKTQCRAKHPNKLYRGQ